MLIKDLRVGTTKADPRKIDKSISWGQTLTSVWLKEGTSLLKPTFILTFEKDDLSIDRRLTEFNSYNYVFVPDLGRYYFISNITFDTGARLVIECTVDVLKTYASEILSKKCIVTRQEKKNSKMYVDDRIVLRADRQQYIQDVGSLGTGTGAYIALTVTN